MTEQEMRSLGADCYAAFNRSAPTSSQTWRLWSEICSDVPFSAAKWIRGKIIRQDTLPYNFGKEVSDLAREWRSENCAAVQELQCCSDCDRVTPGFFHWWKQEKDGGILRSGIMRCACNNDQHYSFMPPWTKSRAVREGYAVMPSGQSSPSGFEQAAFGAGAEMQSGVVSDLAYQLAQNPVFDETARRSHAKYMQESEGWL